MVVKPSPNSVTIFADIVSHLLPRDHQVGRMLCHFVIFHIVYVSSGTFCWSLLLLDWDRRATAGWGDLGSSAVYQQMSSVWLLGKISSDFSQQMSAVWLLGKISSDFSQQMFVEY